MRKQYGCDGVILEEEKREESKNDEDGGCDGCENKEEERQKKSLFS